MSGVTEHTELLTYIINHARKKQRQAIITLLDLPNALSWPSLIIKSAWLSSCSSGTTKLKIIIAIMQYLLGQTITQQNRYLYITESYKVIV